MQRTFLVLLSMVLAAAACTKENTANTTNTSGARLVFKYRFDSTQARLNNIGLPAAMLPGHAGQSPVFNTMSAHYIELAPTAWTPLTTGAVIYRAAETSQGGGTAIDFDQSTLAGNGEPFFSIPIKDVPAGTYQWLRVSLAYQNYDVQYLLDTSFSGVPVSGMFTGTIASFIGFNTFIRNYRIKDSTFAVNASKKQGYWGFETAMNIAGTSYHSASSGQSPEGATTVPNPIASSSPVPAGSCVVTAAFAGGALTITGNESADIVVEVSLSTNKSFEWIDLVPDGRWEPWKGEAVVDMGIRGMVPTVR